MRFCKFLQIFAKSGCFLIKVALFLMKVVCFLALFGKLVLAGKGIEFFWLLIVTASYLKLIEILREWC
jgi:hypothetical protein